MKIIKSTYNIIENELQEISYEKRIEKCGRLCYKSEDKITDISAPIFIRNVRDKVHNSVLEMAMITLEISNLKEKEIEDFYKLSNNFLKFDVIENKLLITGSFRAFREHYINNFRKHNIISKVITNYLKDNYFIFFEDITTSLDSDYNIKIKEVSTDELNNYNEYIRKKHTHVAVHLVVNRAVSHEIVRHRTCQFLQSSQRYCRYSNDKFGNEVTFIKPCFYKERSKEYKIWKETCLQTERDYLDLLETSSPQAARTVLPNSCYTEIIVYTDLLEWEHIFKLRDSKNADPSMQEIMKPLHKEFQERYGTI